MNRELIQNEVEKRLEPIDTKKHVSVRWEQAPGICRIGIGLDDYNWNTRDQVIATLLDFENAYVDEIAVEFDILPLESLTTVGFVEV